MARSITSTIECMSVTNVADIYSRKEVLDHIAVCLLGGEVINGYF